jgi:signal transduction histidine kinase
MQRRAWYHFEDDGIGISPDDKNRLLTRGFGKSTGFGLFLSLEILSVFRISITENGTSGHGVRFEIIVPHGNLRYRKQ